MARRAWRLVSASEIGTSHIGTGKPCQDYISYKVVKTSQGEFIIAVVCDGAGSAAHSDVGSWLAATTFVEFVELHFTHGGRLEDVDKSLVLSWINKTASRIVHRAEEDGNPFKEYACTFLGAIIGPRNAVFAQIGDGAIVVSHGDDDGWNWVFWPQHGEYANQTNFILSKNVEANLLYDLAPRQIDEFAIFSDGIERLVVHYETKTVNEQFFSQMIKPVRTSPIVGLNVQLSSYLKNYLGSDMINRKTDDDKSLFLASRKSIRRQKNVNI